MRRFADLHLRPSIEDLDQVERMISKASELGYQMVAISLPTNISQTKIHQLQKICGDANIDLVTRVDLAPKTSKELLHNLRRFRRRFEIISAICDSKPVARQAAKDRRVDLLTFPATNVHKRFFDYAEAELASNALSSLEIEMAPLLFLKGSSRIRLVSSLRRESSIAEKFGVPIVISSGATDEYLMRGPREYAALAGLFDMTTPVALNTLSKIPFSLVERNREKLSPNYVAPGIRVVKEGDCCQRV
ncbi:MAG: RNase P subunit p30 family protein [Candidatus Bathyarchaeia archaeon]